MIMMPPAASRHVVAFFCASALLLGACEAREAQEGPQAGAVDAAPAEAAELVIPRAISPEQREADPRFHTPEAERTLDEGEDLYRRGLYEEAMAWWHERVEEGDANAAFRLGVEYLDAKVVPRDIARAVRFQRLAAELGDRRAMFELGTFYEHGVGLPRSLEEAARWYLASAERGYAVAQHNIATMFETGVGVEKDLRRAYMFYSLAQAQGFTGVGEAGDEDDPSYTYIDPTEPLALAMTEEEIAQAERMFREFRPVR
jgi:hypothetical protein